MSQLNIIQCPQCREYISLDAASCRFCSAPIDHSVAQAAAQQLVQENKKDRRKGYTRHMLIGAGLFVAGFVITFGSYFMAAASESGGSYLITYGLMFSGGIDFLYGVVGHIGELKSS
jgi:hypothetical protein